MLFLPRLIVIGGPAGLLSLFVVLFSVLLLGFRLLIRVEESVEVQRVWEVQDDRLRFMSRTASDVLTSSLLDGDVSSAWAVWSSAAETALADAYCFSGGLVPDRGLVLGRGTARLRVVRLGGPKVRKVRGSAVDPADGGGIHLYRDSSTAPLLDLRRRLKVVF